MKYSDGVDRKTAAIVLCAGKGRRTGLPYNKMLMRIGGDTVAELTLRAFVKSGICDDIIMTVSPEDEDVMREIADENGARIVYGGESRTESVRNALAALSSDTEIVLIHDGARPFVSPALITAAALSAAEYGSGVAAVPSVDAIKEVRGNYVTRTLDKSALYNVQTPQAFRFDEITDAYSKISGDYGDDSEVYELAGYRARIVRGEYTNTKITTHADLFRLPGAYRTGIGFDVHRFAEDRDLILGGVLIPYPLGLLGHSDADVLVHAVMDAMLSASDLPDIGVLFPDTDPAYKGISSILLLDKVCDMLRCRGVKPVNVSAVVMAEKPRLAGYIPAIRESLARALALPVQNVNVSATTTEKLGICGEGKGMAASAIVLVTT